MGCICPILVKKSGRRDWVPCGKCNYCLESRRNDWTFRLLQEQKVAVSSHFLTLTYDDDKLPYRSHAGEIHTLNQWVKYSYGNPDPDVAPSLNKLDLQLFTKRLRKANDKINDYGIRYYSVGEYGTRTRRPHYHSIMFNLHPSLKLKIHDIWGHGHVHVGECTQASIHYVTKYVINKTEEPKGGGYAHAPPFSFMSSKPGLGANYLNTHFEWHRENLKNYTQIHGQKNRIPRYYKNQLFTENERALLAAEAVALGDIAYSDTVAIIGQTNPNPYSAYDESIRYSHDKITSKINSQNKF